jgi:N-acetyl-gamma-glutamyl-phosphate reductase
MVKIGIIGGAGYTAGEMLRVALNHPEIELGWVHSKSSAGAPLCSVHEDLIGETDQEFTDDHQQDADVVFLCLGHGDAKQWLEANEPKGSPVIIDLSQDYRIEGKGNDFVYGLPEMNREQIRTARRIANPGCFATGIQLALLPLAAAGELKSDLHINAITGSTGAGQRPSPTTHFSWRNNNVSVYKAFAHQHLREIGQSLRRLQPGFANKLNFIPVRGNFSRGILASSYLTTKLSGTEARSIYRDYYRTHPFVHLSGQNINVKQVVNTNKCVVHVEKYDDKLLIVSAIDNLVKGASGQALQNMNLACGLPETAGLNLKPIGF